MTRTTDPEPIQPLPEPERTLRLLSKRLQEETSTSLVGEDLELIPEIQQEMAANNNNNNNNRLEDEANRTMYDYARPSLDGTQTCIARPNVAANNFEIKPNVIQMVQHSVQFGGLSDEDPNAHIASFIEICDTFKINGVSDDAIRLRLFPFSLRYRAKRWLQSLPPGTITT